MVRHYAILARQYALIIIQYLRKGMDYCVRGKNNSFYFSVKVADLTACSRPLVEMRSQLVDGGEPHHPFGHLRLDRTIGIQRIGHAIDHA